MIENNFNACTLLLTVISKLFLDIIVILSEEGSTWQEQDSNEELIDSELNADLASLLSNAG